MTVPPPPQTLVFEVCPPRSPYPSVRELPDRRKRGGRSHRSRLHLPPGSRMRGRNEAFCIMLGVVWGPKSRPSFPRLTESHMAPDNCGGPQRRYSNPREESGRLVQDQVEEISPWGLPNEGVRIFSYWTVNVYV